MWDKGLAPEPDVDCYLELSWKKIAASYLPGRFSCRDRQVNFIPDFVPWIGGELFDEMQKGGELRR